MKIYEIYDRENDIEIGTLLYYEKEKAFIIELVDKIDEWTAPLMLDGFVKKKVYTIPKDISYDWVKERVIPSGRQNINDILRQSKLKEYDEMKLLELSEGLCCQDSLCIRKLSKLPEYVADRQRNNLEDVCFLDNQRLLCIFKNTEIKLVSLSKLNKADSKDIVQRVKKNRALYESGKVGTGGYSITFNDSLDISSKELYDKGELLPITKEDLFTFIKNNVYDTVKSCSELECTRQNIAYLNTQKELTAIKENVKGNLYLKGEVIKNKWD